MHAKPWLDTYRRYGISADIDADSTPSVLHLFEAAMKKYADRPAFRSFGATLTYADVDRLSADVRRLAAASTWRQEGRPRRGDDAEPARLPDRAASASCAPARCR